ncbi:nuclease-related domain-containing protein [Neobacillus mesonae]|uniref:nuclease-related domain-containing protein n=1 Tax=Neobacillus mesonae TaxID=1193713 RepID=UPI002041F2A8|nr:nuclease-related domain-containing protein [Neobacillus mesonae]MCM3570668.1 NERD domain-containing protein [Neobacillus mesonae]
MLKRPLTKPRKLTLLEFLNKRMDLPKEDKYYFFNLKKGYEGELMFHSLTEKLACDCYILNDLRFEFNNTTFQIDSMIETSQTLYMHEVKNFDGDYFYKNGRFYSRDGLERKDPLIQLERSSSQLRQMLRSLGSDIKLVPYVVHINPEFTLYQAPLDAPIIFPTQVKRYMTNLNVIPSKLNSKHEHLAEKLISLHVEEDPYVRLPSYSYDGLRKGNTCELCDSFSITVHGKNCVCGDCGHVESIEAAVLRGVWELKLLFPGVKITTNLVFDWCRLRVSKKTISRILGRYFRLVGVHQWSYFE